MTEIETATINLLWHPQAQFAGYLVAERLDLGRAYGVRLETTPLEFGVGPVHSVLSGASAFGVASPAHSTCVSPSSMSLSGLPSDFVRKGLLLLRKADMIR